MLSGLFYFLMRFKQGDASMLDAFRTSGTSPTTLTERTDFIPTNWSAAIAVEHRHIQCGFAAITLNGLVCS
jgi:hypothetical protein